MKEKLYAIPVNDAFNTTCECPICVMRNKLESDAIDYTMGPSYMEDDTRLLTDENGFCTKHLKMVYAKENRLGMALVLSTHLKKINEDIEKLINSGEGKVSKPSIFAKKAPSDNAIVNYINALEEKCFVCQRIDNVFERYIATIFYLYNTDQSFVTKYKQCQGFCTKHYKTLLMQAPKHLSNAKLTEFIDITNKLYIENMKRVQEDVEWFVAKFDYRNENEPWKNAKDSLPRALTKLNRD